MKRLLFLACIYCILIIPINSCKKEAEDLFPKDGLIAEFSYTLNGTEVTFYNQSQLANTFEWDFGDGTTSTEKNPVHQYPVGKGKYLVTLKATANDGRIVEGSSVINIDKTSNISLDDGTLNDWNTIKDSVLISDTSSAIISGKFSADGSWVYIYVQQKGNLTDGTIQSIYLDKDASMDTGFYPYFNTNNGADFEMEGEILIPEADRWFDIYKFTGEDDHTTWSWGDSGISDFYKIGHIEEDNGVVRYELGLNRNRLGLETVSGVNISFIVLSSEWSEIGFLPGLNESAYHISFE